MNRRGFLSRVLAVVGVVALAPKVAEAAPLDTVPKTHAHIDENVPALLQDIRAHPGKDPELVARILQMMGISETLPVGALQGLTPPTSEIRWENFRPLTCYHGITANVALQDVNLSNWSTVRTTDLSTIYYSPKPLVYFDDVDEGEG